MLMITLYAEQKKKTHLQNSLLDSVGEGEGGMVQENSIETCILSRVKQITSPDWMHETSARTWCTGKSQRERVEREVGGGIGMGNACKPMAVSFPCMTKFTTNKKGKKNKLYFSTDLLSSVNFLCLFSLLCLIINQFCCYIFNISETFWRYSNSVKF